MDKSQTQNKLNDALEQIKDLCEIKRMIEKDDVGDLTRQWIEDRQFELDKKVKQYREELNETVRYSRFEDCDPRGCARHSLFQDDMGEE